MQHAEASIANKFRHLWCMVGNTPMLEIHFTYKGKQRRLFVKCENFNLTGSIKDRMALYILERAYKEGSLRPNHTIVEATSGNTGIAFSAIGKALGNCVVIIMPNWLSKERMAIIRSLGAEIILVSKEEGGFLGSIQKAEQMAKENEDVFLPRQFDNTYNIEAHEKTTAREIWMQLQNMDLEPHAFVAGVGTGGTVMGVARYFKKRNPNILVCPLEPMESPTLSTGYKVGSHRIQGISDEFIPSIVKLDTLDHVVQASDGDSILMAQKLARQLGLAVGISSGANFIGAIQLQDQLGDDANVVTIFCDSNKKYLSTDLMKEEPVKEGYYSSETEFLSYTPIPRIR